MSCLSEDEIMFWHSLVLEHVIPKKGAARLAHELHFWRTFEPPAGSSFNEVAGVSADGKPIMQEIPEDIKPIVQEMIDRTKNKILKAAYCGDRSTLRELSDAHSKPQKLSETDDIALAILAFRQLCEKDGCRPNRFQLRKFVEEWKGERCSDRQWDRVIEVLSPLLRS